MKFHIGKIILVLLMICALLLFALYIFIASIGNQKGTHSTDVMMVVNKGAGLFTISQQLARVGIISHPFYFDLAVLLRQTPFQPRAGEYRFPAYMTIDEIIAKLNAGNVYQRRFKILEGWNSDKIMKMMDNTPYLTGKIDTMPAEGSIFPDTYFYIRGMERSHLIAQMQNKMTMILSEIWRGRQDNLPYKTSQDLLIMASIIEKEAAHDDERAKIASVFINRLRRNMRLQSDPTVFYGLISDKRDKIALLSRSDLSSRHKWNTYIHRGLPPTAITNPGLASLQAAAHPSQTDYLYFVADGKGRHYFAKTLNMHNKNVQTYRQFIKEKQHEFE